MAANTRKPNASPPVKLSTLFSRPMEWDGPEVAALWKRHFAGDVAADHALFVHYAPIVRIVARKLKLRRPDLFSDGIDEMVSDGAMGLLAGIRLTSVGHAGFRLYVSRKIAGRIYNEVASRRFGGDRGLRERNVIAAARGRLTAELGRLSDATELAAALRGQITNPNIVIHGETQIYCASQLGDGERTPTPATRDAPDERMIDADTLRIACRGLDPIDRSILKMMLKGETPQRIAAKVKLSRSGLDNRLRGVLWKCRCNAKLAEHLEADAEPMDLREGWSNDRNWKPFPIRFFKPGPPPCRAAG